MLSALVLAQTRWGRGGLGHRGGGALFAVAGGVLLLAALGVAIWALARTYRNNPRRADAAPVTPAWADPAVGELRVRFARGEIDADEYQRRANLLAAPAFSPPPTDGPPTAQA